MYNDENEVESFRISPRKSSAVFGNLRKSSEIFSSLRESVSAKMPKIKLLHVIEPKN